MKSHWDSCIFDLDGTLWDSVTQITAIWNDVLKAEKIDRTLGKDEVQAIMGLNTVEIGASLLPGLAPERQMEIMLRCTEAESERLPKIGGTPYPAVETTLNRLCRELPLFIVSNCDKGYIEAFLSFHKLANCFKDFICYGDTGRDKPENIAFIAEKHGLKNPVYIGDTEKDRFSAEKAGVEFIYASYGFGTVEAASAVLKRFQDLPDLIFTKE